MSFYLNPDVIMKVDKRDSKKKQTNKKENAKCDYKCYNSCLFSRFVIKDSYFEANFFTSNV